MLDRVLILSASAGAGHLRAAEALEKAFLVSGRAREVKNIDVLTYTNKAFRNLYSKAYIDLVNNAPELLGWLYDHFDKPGKHERTRLAFNKLNMRRIIHLLKEYQPDVAVCTHFLPSEIISWLKGEGSVQTKLAVVVTDFDVHAMWLCQNFEHYFVALEETGVHLEELGVPRTKITVSGIPIDPVFAEAKDKRAMRMKHGLNPEGRTILISAGGFGVGPIEHLMTSLMKLQHEAQVIAICGRSQELYSRLSELAAQRPRDSKVKVHVTGFTKEMDEFMTAADIVVGKPGGLTTSEALAKSLVYVVVNPIPGQEERNSDHLLEQGAAIRCNNLPALAYKVDELLADPSRFEAMKQHSRAMGRPRAAFTVVEKLASEK